MNVNLSVSDRLVLVGILPKEVGSIRESIRIQNIREKLSFDDSEKESLQFSKSGNGVSWDSTKESDREFYFTDSEVDVIALSFAKLEQRGTVPSTPEFVSLYFKFEDEIEDVLEEFRGNNK